MQLTYHGVAIPSCELIQGYAMSLYRQHQYLIRMVDWSDNARFTFPAILVLEVTGIFDIGASPVGNLLVIVGAAVASWCGMKWHTRARAALRRFESRICRSQKLTSLYMADTREGQIADLRSELMASITLAAVEAKKGNAVAAGLAYGYAKTLESRLRQRGG